MSSTLTVQDIATRLSQFPHDRYLYVGGFMRGVALAAGTYVLVEILINFKDYKFRLVPWLAAFAATMVTLTTWGRGVLLTNSRANVFDTLLPTLMGIAEFDLLQFCIRAKTLTEKILSGLGTWSLGIFGLS